MIGLGTIVNAAAIVAGGLLGLVCGKLLQERYRETILKAMGFAIIVMALGSTFSQMLTVTPDAQSGVASASLGTQGVLMMIISMALGALLGELLNIDGLFERFGVWLREKTGNGGDGLFIDAFVSSSLTVCVGAMAIIGSIQDGISADHETLFAKALLDFVIIMMMTSSLGKGCIFSAIPVLAFQGTITLLSRLISPIMTEAMLSNISLVGNVLIMCVGANLLFPKFIRVANLLPAVLIAAVAALL